MQKIRNTRVPLQFYILAAIFCFANMKVKVTKCRMLYDSTHKFNTHKLWKNKVDEKNRDKKSEKKSCFTFQPMLTTHIFRKGFNILLLKKYMIFIIINNTIILGIHTSGFRKYMFDNKKSCLSVCGETSTYSTAILAPSEAAACRATIARLGGLTRGCCNV